MNKGNFAIICNSQDQAHQLKADLGRMGEFVSVTNANVLGYFSYRLIGDQIIYLTGKHAPDWSWVATDARINDCGLVLLVTPDEPIESIRSSLREFLFKRAKAVFQSYRDLKREYPTLTFHLCKVNAYKYTMQMVSPLDRGSNPSKQGLDPFGAHRDTIEDYLHRAAVQQELLMSFSYLYFLPTWKFIGRGHLEVHVWVAKPTPDGGRCDGTATGFSFAWPLSDVVMGKLIDLNYQAGKSQLEGMFFCTHCQLAKHRSERAGSLFAEVRCKACATDEWRERVDKEDYN